MGLHNHIHKTQAQADARLHHIRVSIAAIELRPDSLLFIGRDADAIIRYRNHDFLLLSISAGNMDIDYVARILHRVLHQIADHIQKLVSISHVVCLCKKGEADTEEISEKSRTALKRAVGVNVQKKMCNYKCR